MATIGLIKEAIAALKDRTGSSRQAITKWIESEKKVSPFQCVFALGEVFNRHAYKFCTPRETRAFTRVFVVEFRLNFSHELVTTASGYPPLQWQSHWGMFGP